MNLNKAEFNIKNSQFLDQLNESIKAVISDLDEYNNALDIYKVKDSKEFSSLDISGSTSAKESSILLYIGKKDNRLYFLDVILISMDLFIDIFVSIGKLVILSDEIRNNEFIYKDKVYIKYRHNKEQYYL